MTAVGFSVRSATAGIAAGNVLRDNALSGMRTQQPTLLRGNTSSENGAYATGHTGAGSQAYLENTYEDNTVGTVSCLIGSTCVQLGLNICNADTSCP